MGCDGNCVVDGNCVGFGGATLDCDPDESPLNVDCDPDESPLELSTDDGMVGEAVVVAALLVL